MRIKPASAQEHNAFNQDLHKRLGDGEKLNAFETEFFCNSLMREHRKAFSICDEYRFRDYYFRNLDYKPVPERLKMTETELQELDTFAQDWYEKVVLVTNHSSQTLQHIAKEARLEIKQMAKEFSYNSFLVRNRLYLHKLKKIMWMSRYIHFKILYDYFLGLKRPEIIIPSKFGDVFFNDVSLSHIYSRHYAAGEKQYFPDQSFFGPDIYFNSIHRIITLVLGWITKRNIHIANHLNRAISFKFKNQYYQLYLDKTIIQRRGQGNVTILRVKTLYPVNNNQILQQIQQLVAHQVSKHLILYEQ